MTGKRWIFIGPEDRPSTTYGGFEYGRIYTESGGGYINGHVGPNSQYIVDKHKMMWVAADFNYYLTQVENGSI